MDFGELVFGGNLKKNLKKEAKLNSTVAKTKNRHSSIDSGSISGFSSFFGSPRSNVDHEETPMVLRKHVTKKADDEALITTFAKLPPKNPPKLTIERIASPKPLHLEGPTHVHLPSAKHTTTLP